MKGYGLPRNDEIANPDVGDIQKYVRASHVGKFREICGSFKSYVRGSLKRKSIRRIWKKRERRRLKQELRKEE